MRARARVCVCVCVCGGGGVYHAPTTLVLRQCRSYYAGTRSIRFLLHCL